MSEMAVRTRERRDATCNLCGVEVRQRLNVGVAGSRWWSSEPHAARCGLPCIGGGAGPEVIVPMRARGLSLRDVTHGFGDRCSVCGEVTP